MERELLGAPGTNLYYSSLADDMLVTVRIDEGQVRGLARATVRMP